MDIDTLSVLVGVILGVSLATERLVAIIKTLIPYLRSNENNLLIDAEDAPPRYQWQRSFKKAVTGKQRKYIVQVIVLSSAWVTSAFLAEGGDFNLIGYISITLDNATALKIHVFIMAILASGGSEFWKNVLGYTKATRDLRIRERSGVAASPRKEPDARKALGKFVDLGQPDFDSHARRV